MFAPAETARVRAVVANHNTSMYVEILIRTLLDAHGSRLDDTSLTIVDNNSTDPAVNDLRELATVVGAEFVPSGYGSTLSPNTHGDNLANFVLKSASCDAFLFLDSDIVLLEPDTLPRMRSDLAATPDLWAVQATYVSAEHHRAPAVAESAAAVHTLCTGRRATPTT